MNLNKIGWNSYFEAHYTAKMQADYQAARVFAEHKHTYKLFTEIGEVSGEISGKLRFEAAGQEDFPAVGDWVLVSLRPEEKSATIHHILPRKSKFSRKAAGFVTEEQILAANIDTVFLVNALNKDFNVRRIERYLILAWESGANPVIILSKADLCDGGGDEIDAKVRAVEAAAPGVPIHVISAVYGTGIEELKQYLKEGHTVTLLGSSGVGKSTLLNYFTGSDTMKVQSIREDDDKGKHTSTHRELFLLPEGGLMIDTPGMRELQLWNCSEGISETFSDIESIAKSCAYRNCKHRNEPGCAVLDNISQGILPLERLHNYNKLQKELLFLEKKQVKASKTNNMNNQKSAYKNARSKNFDKQDF